MRRCEANAFDAGLPYRAKQIGKARLAKDISSIGIDVLTKKSDFANSRTHKSGNLVNDLIKRTALFAAANIRNDAIAAEIATSHDGDPRMERGSAMPRHACGSLIFNLLAPNMMVAIFEGLSDKLTHVSDGMGAKDNVNVVEVSEKPLAVTLSDAAANCDNAATARGLRRTSCRKSTVRTDEYQPPRERSTS